MCGRTKQATSRSGSKRTSKFLNDILDLNLTTAEREKDAGDFSVDLVAEDDKGNPVVIENQLERSNHDHLGKLITYLTAVGARAAIWIVSDPRPEHINAVSWLNESNVASFYLLKVEAIRIGDSDPAPLLTLIVGPSKEGREVGETKKEMAERYEIRHRFWTGLLDYAKSKTKLHTGLSPSEYNWIGTGAGFRGLGYNYVLTKHAATVDFTSTGGREPRRRTRQFSTSFLPPRTRLSEPSASRWSGNAWKTAVHPNSQDVSRSAVAG